MNTRLSMNDKQKIELGRFIIHDVSCILFPKGERPTDDYYMQHADLVINKIQELESEEFAEKLENLDPKDYEINFGRIQELTKDSGNINDKQHICCICGQSYPESELERDFMVCDICKSEDRAIPTREDKNGKLFAAGDWLKKESSSEMTQVLRIQPNHIVCDPGGFIPTEEIDVWVIHEWIKTSYQYKIIEPRFNIGSPKLKYITPCKFQSGTMIGDCGCFGECKHHIDKNIIHDFVICELYNGENK